MSNRKDARERTQAGNRRDTIATGGTLMTVHILYSNRESAFNSREASKKRDACNRNDASKSRITSKSIDASNQRG